jgi:hypothetical protein
VLISILRGLLSPLNEVVRQIVFDALHSLIRSILKRFALTIFGAFLASFGAFCLLVGLVRLLTAFVQEWAAWLIVGALASLLGSLIVMMAMPRRSH